MGRINHAHIKPLLAQLLMPEALNRADPAANFLHFYENRWRLGMKQHHVRHSTNRGPQEPNYRPAHRLPALDQFRLKLRL